MTTSIDEIKSLIQQHLGLPLQDLTLPANYAQLREQAVSKELADELHLLRDLSNSVDDEASFKEEFKRLCAIREKRNENKTLSYFAMPEGVCNALYWDIAKILFKPNNLIELLEILMPSIKHSFNVNLSVTRPQSTNPSSYQYQIDVERAQLEKLDILSEDADSDLLKEDPCYLMTLQKGQAIPTKDRGCYLYRYGLMGKTLVMVVHDENHTETLCLSDADIIDNLDWPKEGKITITPSDELIKLIKDAHLRPSLLTCFVVEDGELFNLEQMEKLPLDLHLQLYKRLEKHPALKDKIYQHSDDLKQLLSHIAFAEYEGKSPRKAICELIHELKLAGERFTGIEKTAADIVTIPLTNFRIYLDCLPEEFRQSVLRLRGSYNKKTIANILCDLELGRCVDSAALELQGIVEKSSNSAVLDKMPLVTKEQLKEISDNYRKYTISTTGYDLTSAIPKEISEPLLKNFQLNNVNDYVDLFLNVPPEEYSTFLSAAKLTGNPKLPKKLAQAFEQNMFNEHQRKAFLDAVLINIDKFPVQETLFFAAKMDDWELVSAILRTQPKEDRLNAVIRLYSKYSGLNIVEYAVLDGKKFITLLNAIPREDRLAVMLHDVFGTNTLCVLTLNTVIDCLQLLPKKDQLTAVMKEKHLGNTLLFLATRMGNADAMSMILNIHQENNSPLDVTKTNAKGDTMLHLAAESGNEEAFDKALNLHKECNHLNAVKIENNHGNTVLHSAAIGGNIAIVKKILALHKEKGATAAKQVNLDGMTILHCAALSGDVETIDETLSFYDKKDQLMAAEKTNADGQTVLHCAALSGKLDALDKILTLYKKEDQPTAVKRKDDNGNNTLHFLTLRGNIECLGRVLKLYPEEERLSALKEQNHSAQDVKNVVSLLLSNNHVKPIPALLDLLPTEHRPTLLEGDFYPNTNVFYVAIKNEEWQIIKELLDKITEEEQLAIIRKPVILNRTSILQERQFISHFEELYKTALSEDSAGVNNRQLAEFDSEHPELGLKRLQKTNTLNLDERYSKFANTQRNLQDNIIKIIDNFVNPRGGFLLSLHWHREYLGEARALLNALTYGSAIMPDELSSLLSKTYGKVASANLRKINPTDPNKISFARRLAYCCDMVAKENTNNLEPVNENVMRLSI